MNSPRNLWPVGIIAVCATFVVSTAALLVFACSQRVELVSHDYYEQELKFQNHIDRVDHTRRTAAKASIAYDPAEKCITVSLPAEQARQHVSGSVELYRPSAAGMDRTMELAPDTNGVQRVDATDLVPGLWRVRVTWTAEKQSYYLEQKVVVGSRTS